MANSGSAAQFMKALTLMVCSVYGSLTSQRLVQCTVHKCKFLGFFNLCVRKVDFLQQFTIVTGMRPQYFSSAHSWAPFAHMGDDHHCHTENSLPAERNIIVA